MLNAFSVDELTTLEKYAISVVQYSVQS